MVESAQTRAVQECIPGKGRRHNIERGSRGWVVDFVELSLLNLGPARLGDPSLEVDDRGGLDLCVLPAE
jgi:hypothetical protein